MKLTISFVDIPYTVDDYDLCCRFSALISKAAKRRLGVEDEMEMSLNQLHVHFPMIYQWMLNHKNDEEVSSSSNGNEKKRKYERQITEQDLALIRGHTTNIEQLELIRSLCLYLEIPQLTSIMHSVISEEMNAKRAREGESSTSSASMATNQNQPGPSKTLEQMQQEDRENELKRERDIQRIEILTGKPRIKACFFPLPPTVQRPRILEDDSSSTDTSDRTSSSIEISDKAMETDSSPEPVNVSEREVPGRHADDLRAFPDPELQAARRERSESLITERSDDLDLASVQDSEENTSVRVITTEGFYTPINLAIFNRFSQLINDNYYIEQNRRTITLNYVRKEIFEGICRWILNNKDKKEYYYSNYPRKSTHEAPNTDLDMTEMDEVFFLEYYNNNLLQPLIEAAQATEVFALADLAIKYELNKGFGRETRYNERKCIGIRQVKQMQNEEVELKAQRTPSVFEQRRLAIAGDQLSAAIASIKPYSHWPPTSSQGSQGPSAVTSSSSISSSQRRTNQPAHSTEQESGQQPTQSTEAVNYRVPRVSPLSSSSEENAPPGANQERPARNPESSSEDDQERINPQLPELRREDENTTSPESSGSSPPNPTTSSSSNSSNRTPPGGPNGEGTSESEGTDPSPEDDSGLDSADGDNGDYRRNRGNVQGGNEERDASSSNSGEEGAPRDAESSSSSSSEKNTESKSGAGVSKSESEPEVLGINEDTRSSVGDDRPEEKLEKPLKEKKSAPVVPPNTPRKSLRNKLEQ